MDRETRRKIIDDYEKVNDNILRILGGGPNFFIGQEQYINPKVIFSEVPLNDSKGELYYFSGIRRALEEVLINEKTFIRISHAPDYVAGFID